MFWGYTRHEHNSYYDYTIADILKKLSAGTTIIQLIIRNTNITYSKVSFEGLSGNIALFHGGNIPRPGILRICTSDIVALVF
ncbi:MAG: hypothetical protein ACE3JP_16605 [Ectobacillus sp.]